MSVSQILLLAGAGVAWLMLKSAWRAWVNPRLDARVEAAWARGERVRNIPGLSNYEQAEIADAMHRADQAKPWEKSLGFGIAFGVPIVIVLLVLWTVS